MANDQTPTDDFSVADGLLNQASVAKAGKRPDASRLRTMFTDVPAAKGPVGKPAAATTQMAQQLKPRSGLLAPSL
jgi:hypothetical protein